VQSTWPREDVAFELRFRATDQVVGDAHKKMQAFEVRRAIGAAASLQNCVLCQTTRRAEFLRRPHPDLRKSQTTMNVVFSMVDTDMRTFRDPLRCPDSRSDFTPRHLSSTSQGRVRCAGQALAISVPRRHIVPPKSIRGKTPWGWRLRSIAGITCP
jgi:hypothetical protein